MSSDIGLRFYVGTKESGEAVYGDFQTAGHFISAGSTGSGHASFDEAAHVILRMGAMPVPGTKLTESLCSQYGLSCGTW